MGSGGRTVPPGAVPPRDGAVPLAGACARSCRRPAAVYFGPAFQNFRHDSFTSNAYTLLLGYRRYLCRGLNLEFEAYPAYNPIYSHVTESRYPGVELWLEAKVGFRIDLGRRLYLHPAPGVGFGVFRTNRPPNFNEEIKGLIFVPQVVLGVRL